MAVWKINGLGLGRVIDDEVAMTLKLPEMLMPVCNFEIMYKIAPSVDDIIEVTDESDSTTRYRITHVNVVYGRDDYGESFVNYYVCEYDETGGD